MGNFMLTAAPAGRLLELRLTPPHVDVPADESGQPCVLFARVGVLGDPGSFRSVLWDEAVTVRLLDQESAALISIFAAAPGSRNLTQAYRDGAAHFVGEACLPYAGHGGLGDLGLRAGGDSVQLRLALVPGARCSEAPQEELAKAFACAQQQFRKDRPYLILVARELESPRPTAREAPGAAMPSQHHMLPVGRLGAIALEVENAALEAQHHGLHTAGPEKGGGPERPVNIRPSHIKQLQLILSENVQLQGEIKTAWQRLGHVRALTGDVRFRKQERQNHFQEPKWGRTLQVMQVELQHCRERQLMITESYEEKLCGLRQQVQRVGAQVAVHSAEALPAGGLLEAEADADALLVHICEAMKRRDDLAEQVYEAWRAKEALESGGSPMSKASALSHTLEGRTFIQQGKQYKAQLAALQEELSEQHKREGQQERNSQEEVRQQVELLYEELDELHQVREDERVRSESEARELRKDRDGLRDRVDDAIAEVKRLRAKAEVTRDLNLGNVPASAASLVSFGLPTSTADLARFKEEDEAQAKELKRLRQSEEDRKVQILELEREQEALVDQMGVISSRAALVDGGDGTLGAYSAALEARVSELDQQLERAETSCQEQRMEVNRMRCAAQEAQARSEGLKRDYYEMQKISDERVLRTPQGAAVSTPPVQCGGG